MAAGAASAALGLTLLLLPRWSEVRLALRAADPADGSPGQR